MATGEADPAQAYFRALIDLELQCADEAEELIVLWTAGCGNIDDTQGRY